MNVNRKRLSLAVLVALCVAVATALADAQSTPTYTYDITQFGQSVGLTTMTLERSPEGTTARSTVSVGGLFQAENLLVTGPDGAALTYELNGTAQGAPFELNAVFSEGMAELTFSQGGTTQSAALGASEPYYVFDNNFLEGFQIAADQVMATGQGRVFLGLVPQTAAEATLTFGAPQPSQVELEGETVTATLISVEFAVGGQQLVMAIMLDAAGDILMLEQQPGMVRFVRRPGEGADAEPNDAPGGDDVPLGDKVEGVGEPVEAPAASAQRALQAAAHCVAEREVTVHSTGETLYGRLTLPVAATLEGGVPAPTLLLLPGSGAVDVDGNALPFITHQGYRQLAFELACHGYGVLRVAKLGISPSTGDGNAVTLQTYAQNTADWLALLAAEPGVDPDRLGIMGHSEGGLIALYATAEAYVRPAVVVLAAAPGRPFDVLLREQLLASFERSGPNDEDLQAWAAMTDQALDAIRASDGTALELTGALSSNPIAASFAHAAGLLRSEFEQDPVLLAARLSVPTLVLQGLKDVQVLQVDGRNLAAALPSGTLLEFSDLSHNLTHVPGPALTGMVPEPDAPLSGTFVQALATWLNGHLRTAR